MSITDDNIEIMRKGRGDRDDGEQKEMY